MITDVLLCKQNWDMFAVFDEKDIAVFEFHTGTVRLHKDAYMPQLKNDHFFHPLIYGERFCLQRNTDVSGVSGTGIVAYGYHFPLSTTVVLHWTASNNFDVEYQGLEGVDRIHGHNGATKIILLTTKETVHGR